MFFCQLVNDSGVELDYLRFRSVARRKRLDFQALLTNERWQLIELRFRVSSLKSPFIRFSLSLPRTSRCGVRAARLALLFALADFPVQDSSWMEGSTGGSGIGI